MKIITKSLLLLLLLPSLSLAATYCLKKSQSLFKAKKEIKSILLPDEAVLIDSRTHCLEVAVRDYRKSLVNKYIRMSFTVTSQSQSSPSRRRICKIKVKKVISNTLNSRSLNLGNRVDIRDNIDDLQETSNSEMIVMEGRQGSISTDNSALFITCHKSGEGHELTFSATSGSSSGLSTTVYVSPGKWVNAGQISTNLNNKTNSKSLSTGLKNSKSSGQKKTTYFITVID
ncbi:MAG: hypothetical protein BM556_03830 [Bacteriovorax sp. MedPE-SWde]|nr:MAG: hypothetical protein BM556_03830 [Bacteriovorax sp. MedPE-SWde]